MPSTLMVYDGIKALSGARRRCLEPRPWVALHRWRAVISVPCCQKSSPFLPKTPSICSISRGRVGAMHFSAICCCTFARSRDQSSATINTSVKVNVPKNTFFFCRSGLYQFAIKVPHQPFETAPDPRVNHEPLRLHTTNHTIALLTDHWI